MVELLGTESRLCQLWRVFWHLVLQGFASFSLAVAIMKNTKQGICQWVITGNIIFLLCSVFVSFLEQGTNPSPSPAAPFRSAKLNDITHSFVMLLEMRKSFHKCQFLLRVSANRLQELSSPQLYILVPLADNSKSILRVEYISSLLDLLSFKLPIICSDKHQRRAINYREVLQLVFPAQNEQYSLV